MVYIFKHEEKMIKSSCDIVVSLGGKHKCALYFLNEEKAKMFQSNLGIILKEFGDSYRPKTEFIVKDLLVEDQGDYLCLKFKLMQSYYKF